MNDPKPARRSVHRTQWAAQFAVASELCKRGYEVAFTMGNHPSVDLMVTSPAGLAFHVDVKGLYKKNFWVVRPKPLKGGLFYVFAFVPDDSENEFFILTQEEANAEIAVQDAKSLELAIAKGKERPKDFWCVGWPAASKYRHLWEKLPS